MTTNGLSTEKRILLDFDVNSVIKLQFHVESHNPASNSQYDIIIGRGLLSALTLIIDYQQKQFI